MIDNVFNKEKVLDINYNGGDKKKEMSDSKLSAVATPSLSRV